MGIDLFGQALEQLQRLAAQVAAVDDAVARRQVAEKEVFGDGHLRHQLQFLLDHGDAGADGFGGALEHQFLAIDVEVAGGGSVVAAEDLQQGRLARAVLAHEGMHRAGTHAEGDVGERLDAGKGLADADEAEAFGALGGGVFQGCHGALLSDRRGWRRQDRRRRGHHFQRPIFSSSCWKLARVMRVTLSIAVYLGGSLPVVTHSYIMLAVW
ncbi:hypothetical protein Q3H58_001424 [Pseudomonas psychrotolerans]|nr:hypothetical protein [Pseudomonas psychrotolerans]